jgi:MFS family permease
MTNPAKRRNLVDLTPLKEVPAFARLWWGSLLSGLGSQLTLVAVALLIYEITHDTAAVALVGGIALVPMVLAGPIGGMITDAFERRLVMILAASVMFTSTAGLLALSIVEDFAQLGGYHAPVWPIYLCTTITAVSATVLGSARHASIPRILPKELITKASALNGISMGTQIMVGPALAGVLIAVSNFSFAFAADLALTATGFLGIINLPKLHASENATRPGWKSFKESIVYLKQFPEIGAGFIVDIFAMVLGRPYVLLPAAASTVIGGGPITVGILTAAAAAGSFSTSAFSGRLTGIKRQGVAIANSVKIYGLFIALLGLVLLVMSTGWFGQPGNTIDKANYVALAVAALAMYGTGASDEVSAIFRTSMMQTVAPDHMRGRLIGLFISVVGGGPRLGDVYAGVMATLIALWAGPVFGGLGIVVAMFILLRITPRFRNFVAD